MIPIPPVLRNRAFWAGVVAGVVGTVVGAATNPAVGELARGAVCAVLGC